MPEMRNLLELLSSKGLLPFSLTVGQTDVTVNPSEALTQFGVLAHQALLGETPEAQARAWSSLTSFLSGETAKQGGLEWLDLADFHARLRGWQVGKTLDEILLSFNADQVKLAE
jgi:hypothetical protein